MTNGNFYTTAEVAKIFGVNPATVARWIRTGKLTGIHTPGGDLRLPAKQIHAMTGLPQPQQDRQHASQALAAVIKQHFNTDATAALLTLAQLADIDIAYLDRTYFTDYLQEHHGHTLTDDEWKRIARELGEYCTLIDDLCRDAVAAYTDAILRSANIAPPTDND
jgi:excisionase family DNA binding protein